MLIPEFIIANADDFGANSSVNKAISFCFKKGYINSASLLTNMPGFEEAVLMAKQNLFIVNLGVHINFAEGKPLTDVDKRLLTKQGDWNLDSIGKSVKFFQKSQLSNLAKEIHAQINKALDRNLDVTHLDSHYHLHTLPGLQKLFIEVAKQFNLKLRLAQTYREGNYLKFWYRAYINRCISDNGLNYSKRFETVAHFLKNANSDIKGMVEIMLHPTFDKNGKLTDHYDEATMLNWITFLEQLRNN